MDKCAFDDRRRCKALETKVCEGCGFRKSMTELIDGRVKADARLRTLNEYEYYKRKYPGRGNGGESGEEG